MDKEHRIGNDDLLDPLPAYLHFNALQAETILAFALGQDGLNGRALGGEGSECCPGR
jgi:hypothetical protein